MTRERTPWWRPGKVIHPLGRSSPYLTPRYILNLILQEFENFPADMRIPFHLLPCPPFPVCHLLAFQYVGCILYCSLITRTLVVIFSPYLMEPIHEGSLIGIDVGVPTHCVSVPFFHLPPLLSSGSAA